MCSTKEEIKEELKELCMEYIALLEKLKNNKIIDENTFLNCAKSKSLFIEE